MSRRVKIQTAQGHSVSTQMIEAACSADIRARHSWLGQLVVIQNGRSEQSNDNERPV